jgi:hypothetical protein
MKLTIFLTIWWLFIYGLSLAVGQHDSDYVIVAMVFLAASIVIREVKQ